MNTEYLYEVGERVVLAGKEHVVEARSHNYNGKVVYKLSGNWYYETEIERFVPPCPV